VNAKLGHHPLLRRLECFLLLSPLAGKWTYSRITGHLPYQDPRSLVQWIPVIHRAAIRMPLWTLKQAGYSVEPCAQRFINRITSSRRGYIRSSRKAWPCGSISREELLREFFLIEQLEVQTATFCSSHVTP
jgi:hypothetical protein